MSHEIQFSCTNGKTPKIYFGTLGNAFKKGKSQIKLANNTKQGWKQNEKKRKKEMKNIFKKQSTWKKKIIEKMNVTKKIIMKYLKRKNSTQKQ